MQTISIAMATCNGARFIREQLESLARQTVLPAELVVTDDNSTDGTLDIVSAFAATSPFPVRIEKNDRSLGYRANFMKAAGLCRSDIIAFCDQDDVWLPHKLETCLAAFTSKEVLLAYHNVTVVTENLEPLSTMEMRAAPQAFNPVQSLGPWHFGLGFTLTFRRELMTFSDLRLSSTDFQNFNNPEAHDQWIFLLASCLGTIGYIKDPLVLYRRHTQTTTLLRDGSGAKGMLQNLIYTSLKRTQSFERCATARASNLAVIAKELEGEQKQRAEKAARSYEQLARYFLGRWQMYLAPGFLSRLQRFVRLAFSDAYRAKQAGGLGKSAMLRDMFCVISPPFDINEKETETAG